MLRILIRATQIIKISQIPMKNIELFPSETKKQGQPAETNNKSAQKRNTSASRLNSKRPDKLQVTKQLPPNEKWRECKIIGKNVNIRSYSAACAFNKKMYIYGGYQILKGMMSDFYSIDLDDHVDKFNWEQIEAKGELPGPRSKHALIGGKTKIYLVGGLSSDVNSSDEIFQFDPEKKTWRKLKPQGDKLPEIDSFGCVYLTSGQQQKIIIICGYDGKQAEYLNSVYQYNITKNKINTLFPGTKQKSEGVPAARSGCAAATDDKNVYIFGGKDSDHRMKDLWEFSLTDFKYHLMDSQGDIPPERNGHTMQFFEGKLYVFGGIHDITWELDDLHIYSLAKKRWTTLEQDSPRKVDRKKVTVENSSKEKDKKSPKKKNWYDTVNTLYNNKSSITDSPGVRHNNSGTMKEDQNASSPLKMIDEQRKKAFLNKKNEMLKNFQVSKDETNKYVMLEAESQAIKNSLDVIGDPDPKLKSNEGKITEFGKETMSKFLQPLNNNSNLIVGKKPCARDGHSSIILGEELIVFGGDRHQMSFNDIYKLNFSIAAKNDRSEQ